MLHAIALQIIGFTYLKVISQWVLSYYFDVLVFNALILVCTVVFAHFSYQYYEKFFMKFKKKTRDN
jgi:peptidoglycan/LPS O-acetylase OafA/YrhL